MSAVKLKAIVDNIDDVPEVVRQFYAPDEKTGKHQLQAEGYVPSAKLAEFRDTNVELIKRATKAEEDIAAYRSLAEDPAKLNEELTRLRKIEQRISDNELIDKKGFDSHLAQRTEQMKQDFEGKVSALKAALDAASAERDAAVAENRRIVVSGEITRAAVAAGVLPDALNVLLLSADASGWTRNDKGEVVLIDKKTNQIVYGANGADPITPEEWILTQKSGPGRFFFNLPYGSGASGSDEAPGSKNPWGRDTWDDMEQARVYKADPVKAEQLAKAAGSRIGALRPA